MECRETGKLYLSTSNGDISCNKCHKIIGIWEMVYIEQTSFNMVKLYHKGCIDSGKTKR
jgi:hypothetical protein